MNVLVGTALAILIVCTNAEEKNDLTTTFVRSFNGSQYSSSESSTQPSSYVTLPTLKKSFGSVAGCLKAHGVFNDDVLLPGENLYDVLRRPRNSLFHKHPTAIVIAKSTADVVAAVKCAKIMGTKVVPMSGGHSYAGTSTTKGILVSFSAFTNVTKYNKNSGEVTWQPGKRQGDLYVTLWEASKGKHAMAGGVCASVGTSGFMSVGGMGFTMRKWGMGFDGLKSFKLVTADGDVKTVSKTQNTDLWWGRYMCGPQFGIITSLTYVANEVPSEVTVLQMNYKGRENMLAIMTAFNRWLPQKAPDEVGCVLKMNTGQATLQCLSLMTKVKTEELFYDKLVIEAPGGIVTKFKQGTYVDFLTTFVVTESRDHDLQSIKTDHLLDVQDRKKELMHSRVLLESLSDTVLNHLADHFQRDTPVPDRMAFKSMGGRVPDYENTSFPYRHGILSMYYQHPWRHDQDDQEEFFRERFDELESYFDQNGVSKTRYCGYQDTSGDWQERVWGHNLSRMRDLKNKYDPDRLFKNGMDL